MTLHTDPQPTPLAQGADLRALRKARGLTLQDMSARLGRSVGWLSQIERDISTLGDADLSQIAQLLDVDASLLSGTPQGPEDEAGYVVRFDSRRAIGHRVDGLKEELLSPDLTDDFEVVHSTFAPGSRITVPEIRPTQEVGYVISGVLELQIAGRSLVIKAGDSFRIRGEAFTWSNPGPCPAVAIWVIAPPVY